MSIDSAVAFHDDVLVLLQRSAALCAAIHNTAPAEDELAISAKELDDDVGDFIAEHF